MSDAKLTPEGIPMSSRIRIKLGHVELDYEGPESYLTQHLPDLLHAVVDLSRNVPKTAEGTQSAAVGQMKSENQAGNSASGSHDPSTHTIANLLNSKSCADLAKAAAAHLVVVAGKPTFTRKDLLDEMKTATGRFKETFRGGNMRQALEGLCRRDEFRKSGSDAYTLTPKTQQALEAAIAESR